MCVCLASAVFLQPAQRLWRIFTQFLLLFAFILCEGADQSVQQQTQVIICILNHVQRHFNVCCTGSEYSSYCVLYYM